MNKSLLALIFLAFFPLVSAQDKVPAHPYIKFETTEGDIVLELDGRRAPITVANFLELVDSGYYDGTIFHRVIPGFMIQGGGHTPGPKLKEPTGYIFNESGNGLRNLRGTIAMARETAPHTAKAQFFINVNDNRSLNPEQSHWGFAVFGAVIDGMDIVDKISKVRTGPRGIFASDVPIVPIVIKKAYRFEFE